MKTWTGLHVRICSLDNLWLAATKARRHKTRRGDVETFDLRRESRLRELREELVTMSWQPAGYREFRILDPKPRLIHAAPYRDRVVHHALCNVIEPILTRRFIADSYSCQRGKGTLAARERCRRYTSRYRHVLKCDIRKYYQSIDHTLLMDTLGRTIRCENTLELCRRIVASYRDVEIAPGIFPGDDLFTASGRPHGLPIGNLTSQLWANAFLDPLDHRVKEEWRAPAYARYTDDWLLWHDDKGFLWDMKERIRAWLESRRLCLHPDKTQVMRTEDGVPFLGFRFFPKHRPRVLGATKRRFERRSRRHRALVVAGRLDTQWAARSASSWRQFAVYGNSKGLIEEYGRAGFGWTAE